MTKKKTPEQFNKEIFEKYGDRYTILTPYVDCKTKVSLQCNNCNYQFETTPSTILKSPVCRNCSNIKLRNERTKSQEQFKKRSV